MLTLAKTVKEWTNANGEFVRFLDDNSIVSCFDSEEDVLIGFNTQSILSFIDKVEGVYKSFDVLANLQTILDCFLIVESFDKNKTILFDALLSDYSNYDLETLVNYVENNACLFEGSARDYAYETVRDCYNIEKTMGSLACYFDYDSFGRDLLLNGDIVEISHNIFWTNPNEK